MAEALGGTCLCGACTWRYEAEPTSATVCNCSACRRYGALWIYGHKDVDVHVAGDIVSFVRADLEDPSLSFDHCRQCGAVVAWTGIRRHPSGQNRRAANLRLVDTPAVVRHLTVFRFDGADTFRRLPANGGVVGDYLF